MASRMMRSARFDHFWRSYGWISVVLPIAAFLIFWWVQRRQPEFDLLILNGRVFDGEHMLPYGTGVGIRNGKIARVGVLSGRRARETWHVGGRVVSPGFIDTHVHVEANIRNGPFRAPNFVSMGITTVITGNCGSSRTDIASLLQHSDAYGGQVNLATLIGHNSVRESVMGKVARHATLKEISAMRDYVDRGMRDGALGFSTGLEYSPGISAAQAEVVALARVAARWGGIYATHMRDEGIGFWASLDESIQTAHDARIPLHISHLKIAARHEWSRMAEAMLRLDKERKTGLQITQDVYAYDGSSTGTDLLVPPEYRGSARAALLDPDRRSAVVDSILKLLEERGFEDFEHARVAYFADPKYRGKTIKEIADFAPHLNWARDACWRRPDLQRQVEAIVHLLLGGGAQMIYRVISPSNVETVLRDQWTMIGSDSSVRWNDQTNAHPRGYGNCARILGEYVRARGVLKLEEALRRMTSLPAATFKIAQIGRIHTGYAADIVIFDPATISDHATYDHPLDPPTGIYRVLVNGTVVCDEHGPKEAYPGKAMRNQVTLPLESMPDLTEEPSLQVTSVEQNPARIEAPSRRRSSPKPGKTHHKRKA
jgi:N-acyl-D-amino-acid deacylase